jgi:hypothetical protein
MKKQILEAAHTLKLQMAAFVRMVETLESKDQKAWAATIPHVTEEEARQRLDILKDKWHREHL